MIKIQVKVVATQISDTIDIRDVDGYATITELGMMRRLVYQEGCGAIVQLDFDAEQVLLNRKSDWTTQASFSSVDTSSARIISSEGEIYFGVNVLEISIKENSIYIKYEMKQADELIDTHIFNCVWTKEEEAWLEIH
ncbi:MAG TPA: DUF1934 family protein [Erysipelothrix sp.]|nr:DUF1934 family protein [Erysipelothrix sp.]